MSIIYGAVDFHIQPELRGNEVYKNDHTVLCCNAERDVFLHRDGYAVLTDSEKCADAILDLYIASGEKLPEQLMPPFAFLIYDPALETVFFACDAEGEKHFFYTFEGSTLLFSNDISALLVHPFNNSGYIHADKAYKNICELSPGWYGSFSEKGIKLRRFCRA